MRIPHALVATLALAAVSGQGRLAVAEPVHYSVLPRDTDGAIRLKDAKGRKEEHQVYVPKGKGNGRLLVYFAGSGGEPEGATALYETAAKRGYHVIGLVYVNDHSLGDMCNDQPTSCAGKVMHENLDGKDRTKLLDVDRANSIENRLVKLLVWLDKKHPEEKWGRYLTKTHHVRWRLAVTMGHSQGGSTAGYIAKVRKVIRAVMMSAPSTGSSEKGKFLASTWLQGKFKTSKSRYFAFVHTLDERWPKFETDIDVLKVPGKATSVNNAKAPYGHSHRLTTSLQVKNPHNSVLNAEYAPVWRYLIGGRVKKKSPPAVAMKPGQKPVKTRPGQPPPAPTRTVATRPAPGRPVATRTVATRPAPGRPVAIRTVPSRAGAPEPATTDSAEAPVESVVEDSGSGSDPIAQVDLAVDINADEVEDMIVDEVGDALDGADNEVTTDEASDDVSASDDADDADSADDESDE